MDPKETRVHVDNVDNHPLYSHSHSPTQQQQHSKNVFTHQNYDTCSGRPPRIPFDLSKKNQYSSAFRQAFTVKVPHHF